LIIHSITNSHLFDTQAFTCPTETVWGRRRKLDFERRAGTQTEFIHDIPKLTAELLTGSTPSYKAVNTPLPL